MNQKPPPCPQCSAANIGHFLTISSIDLCVQCPSGHHTHVTVQFEKIKSVNINTEVGSAVHPVQDQDTRH